MKSLADYSAATPGYELYHFLTEAIIQNDISNFSELLEFAAPLPTDAKTSAVYVRLFPLIRKLSWGFFRDIDPAVYPKVWREIVIPHPKFAQCGDLKRNLTISEVYVGIIDLHGYTRFCEKNKNNLSMLQALDDTIQNEMMKRARAHDVVLQRRQGDEMVLVGASAVDLLTVTLEIIDFFANKTGAGPDAARKLSLPEMHVSAGIAGGKKFTPFIITRDGDLSGGVVNTAARLQSRANELSGERSRIVVSKTVQTSFLAETKNSTPECFCARPIHFFDSGIISFKGMEVAVSEVIADESDRYKVQIEKDMVELYRSLDGSAWKDGVFGCLVMLLIRVYKNMGAFSIETLSNGLPATLTNDSLVHIAQDVLSRFKVKQDYGAAVDGLRTLVEHSRAVPCFDRLCLEYAERILERYSLFAAEFDRRLDAKLKEKAVALPAKHKQLYDEGRKSILLQERLNMEIRKNVTPLEIGQLWAASLDARKDDPVVSIHSGKK